MKVSLLKEDKKYITLEEAPIARRIIANLKEDESTPADYAQYAIGAAYNFNNYSTEILKASAKICRNCRAWKAYGGDSQNLDIWINATAYVNNNEFIMIGAYLSDIWQLTSDNAPEISHHMYIRRFKEMK